MNLLVRGKATKRKLMELLATTDARIHTASKRPMPMLVDLSNLAMHHGSVVLRTEFHGVVKVKLDKRGSPAGRSHGSSETASLRYNTPESEPSLSAFLQDELESTAESAAPSSVDVSPSGPPLLEQAGEFGFGQKQACNEANESGVFSFWPQGALLCTA